MKSLRHLRNSLALRLLGNSREARGRLSQSLAVDPNYRGPVVDLPNRSLINCGDHFMWVLRGDEGVGLGLLKNGEWQRNDFNAAMRLIEGRLRSPAGTFLDIGANIGTHSMYAALSGRFDRIVAIEPEPRDIRLLGENLSLNEVTIPYDVVGKAVGTERRTGFLSLSATDSGMHHVVATANEAAIEIEIEDIRGIFAAINLDLATVSFVWMDVEGAEFDVFPGLSSLLENKTPVFFEYSRLDGERFAYWSRRFEDVGYVAHTIEKGRCLGPMPPREAMMLEFGNILLS